MEYVSSGQSTEKNPNLLFSLLPYLLSTYQSEVPCQEIQCEAREVGPAEFPILLPLAGQILFNYFTVKPHRLHRTV